MINILEILVILVNLISVGAGIAMSVIVLLRNRQAKALGEIISEKEFEGHKTILSNVKITAFCAVVFLVLSWIMLSSRQTGFMSLSSLSFLCAVLWAAGLVATMLISSVNAVMHGKGACDALTGKKIKCFLFWAVVNFIVAFILY